MRHLLALRVYYRCPLGRVLIKPRAADQGAYGVSCAPDSGAIADLNRGPSWARRRRNASGSAPIEWSVVGLGFVPPPDLSVQEQLGRYPRNAIPGGRNFSVGILPHHRRLVNSHF